MKSYNSIYKYTAKFLIFSLFAIPSVIFFQNCGQPGAIGTTQEEMDSKTAANGIPTDVPADALIIDPDTGNNDGDTDASDDGSVAASGCDGIVISDVLLNISSISSALSITDSDPSISLGKQTLKVLALKNVRLKMINLVLNAEGNKVLTNDNRTLNLKTPSGQTSGVKLQLAQELSIEVGKSYLIKLNIDPAQQIVTNPSKCIFKPVIKNTELALE